MTSPGGKLTALTCHPTKKVNKAKELTYLCKNGVGVDDWLFNDELIKELPRNAVSIASIWMKNVGSFLVSTLHKLKKKI